jgi:hypothetical protein
VLDLTGLPKRGWGVLRPTSTAERVAFALLLAGGYIKAQSVSGNPDAFQVRLTKTGREVWRAQLDRAAAQP